MKITNIQQLPSPLPELAAQSCYLPKEGIFRVTELIGPPMVRRLLMDKWAYVTTDVEEYLPALLGTSWHKYLADYPLAGVEQEPRLAMTVDGQTLTGGLDWYLQSEAWLNDWKTASTWSWTFGRTDWEAQLNIYAELLRISGKPVTKCTDTVLFMGWSAAEAKRKPPEEYPPRRLMIINQPVWTSEQVQTFIRTRLNTHAQGLACTEEERWGRGGSFAVYRPGRDRALRVLPTLSEARDYCHEKEIDTSWITERPKIYVRCEKFCPVRSVCPTALAMVHTNESEE
jgi:hypothetical protein